ncbi:hypothetical protein ACHHV8_11165 [Paenibacillus sp. TAB 01]|uniref:hypothetical protein n=1 Tax=Paenibacillus sp. TAB 01 TaxID=3368988 RepID=UPI003750549C
MAFYTYSEAVNKSKTKLEAGIYRTYALKNPLSKILPILPVNDLVYSFLTSNGLGNDMANREFEGAFNEGTGTKTELRTIPLGVYQQTRKIERLFQEYKGDLSENGSLLDDEMIDILTVLTYKSMYDFINADIANGKKFDGLTKIAVTKGHNFSIGDGAVAARLDKDNIFDELSRLQDAILGEDSDKVFMVDKAIFTNIQKNLRLSGLEFVVASDDFGRPYASFRGSLIIPFGSYVVDPQGGAGPEKIDLIPTATYGGTANTHKIICATFGQKNIHALRGSKGTKVRADLEATRPNTHPMVDVEDTFAVVDKTNGNSVAVLEGIIL